METRVELANVIFDYLEMFHNRKRRRSPFGMRTPDRDRTRPMRGAARSAAPLPNASPCASNRGC